MKGKIGNASFNEDLSEMSNEKEGLRLVRTSLKSKRLQLGQKKYVSRAYILIITSNINTLLIIPEY